MIVNILSIIFILLSKLISLVSPSSTTTKATGCILTAPALPPAKLVSFLSVFTSSLYPLEYSPPPIPKPIVTFDIGTTTVVSVFIGSPIIVFASIEPFIVSSVVSMMFCIDPVALIFFILLFYFFAIFICYEYSL